MNARDSIYAALEAFSPQVPRAKPAPCRCGAYPFPHRPARQCDEFADAQREMEYLDREHRRDLDSWAQLSRG